MSCSNAMVSFALLKYVRIFNIALLVQSVKAWCNSGHADAPLKAEALLRKLETNPQYPKQRGGMLVVRPNRLSFNAVINAWAKSRHPKAAVYAENLLIRMIKSYQSDPFSTVKPDVITFSSVLNALAKSKAAGKGNLTFSSCFAFSVLNALAKSKAAGKGKVTYFEIYSLTWKRHLMIFRTNKFFSII